MDWKTFISNILSTSIWPITVMIIVILLRKQLKGLVGSLKNLKYKELEVNFGEKTLAIEEHLEKANIPDSSEVLNKSIQENNKDLILKLYKIKDEIADSPRAAIIEAWLLVEDRLRQLAKSSGLSNQPSGKIISELYNRNILNKELFDACNGLRDFRNAAVHSINFEGHPLQASDFINLTIRVVSALTDKLKR